MQSKIPMEEFVIEMLKSKLPANYYYHNYDHTLDVLDNVFEIGTHENCNEKELNLLKVAALWHDTGYIHTYAGHEEESCLLATEYLPQFGFSQKDIAAVNGMIMATKILQTPTNKLEEILADADLEYLGTNTAAEKAHLLFRELHFLNPSLDKQTWNKMQISFLESHHYFTDYCKQYKDPLRFNYLNKLREEEDQL